MTRYQMSERGDARRRHNLLIGHCVSMRQYLNNTIEARTTTAQSKHLARSILGLVRQLQNSLQERVDP